MAGLLDDPIAALAAQIRAQYGGSGTGSGNWDDAGYDRATELAQLLSKQGITSLGDMSLTSTPYDEAGLAQVNAGRGGFDASTGQQMGGLTLEELNAQGGRKKLKIGDKEVGFLGDFNNDGSFESNSSDFLQGKGTEDLLGWSARGDGNTSYRVVTDPTTGKVSIAPGWNSSSDAAQVRNAAIATAAMMAGGYGLSTLAGGAAGGGLTGVDAAMADYAASGGGSGMFGGAAGGSAGGIGTLGGAGSMPAVPGQVSALSTMGQAAPLAGLAPAASVPTMAQLGSGAGLLGAAGSAAGAAGKVADAASPWLRTAAGLYGAIEGSKEQPGATTRQQMTMDPRLDSRAFGSGGLLESADAQFQKNKATGQNDTMRQGQDWLRGMLTSPGMQQGLQSQQQAAQGLFNLGPNPFMFPGRG